MCKYLPWLRRTSGALVILAAGLAALLALALGWNLSVAAMPSAPEGMTHTNGEAPREDFTPAPDSAQGVIAAPGVITWTFDANNMGWEARDLYTVSSPASWANGQINKSFTNDDDGFPDFARFESPWVTELSGSAGTLSFVHNRSGDMGEMLFSVCIIFSGRDWIPSGTLPCTPWQATSPGSTMIPLTTGGDWAFYQIANVPKLPPYVATPLTEQQIQKVIKTFRQIRIHYVMADRCRSWDHSCRHTSATVALDDVRLEITGVSGKLYASTRYVMDGDTVLFYATVKDAASQPIRSSNEVTMTLTGASGAVRLFDDGTAGDIVAGDGVYSRWETLADAGVKTADLYYRGERLDSLDVTVTPHPHLVVLTDIAALYQGFLDTGMPPGQDDDGDGEIDFYQMLDVLVEYAAQHKGVVYDVRENINTAAGFPVNYASLTFAGDDPATNRFRMAKLIDEALTRMHRASQHTIADVVIIGADDVIPFYRIRDTSGRHIGAAPGLDNPTPLDLVAGYLITDLPYGTVDYVNQDAVMRPSPQVAVGRVAAMIPMGMIGRLNAYRQPVLLDPAQSHATLFIPSDDKVHWSWLEENLWTPIFTRHYPLADLTVTPPPPGYHRYTGYYAWGPETILDELRVANLTVLTTRGDNFCDHTAVGRDICGTDYGRLARVGGRLYVLEASLGGVSPAFYSPSGNRNSFQKAIPRWLQSVHRTQVGTTWLNVGCNSSVALSDYLFANFVAEALDGRNTTVGDAFVHAWDGYWTSPGGNLPIARSVSYGMILWGLPTQPIQHEAGSVAQADLTPYPLSYEERGTAAPPSLAGALASRAGEATDAAAGLTPYTPPSLAGKGVGGLGPTSPTLDRSFTVEINTPNFRMDADASGALLIRPANGGTTYAEGPDLPLLPQVVRRFVLPPDASNIQVTEDTAGRVTQFYGPARLQTAQLRVDCDGDCIIQTAAAAPMLLDSYPTRAFDTEIQERGDGTILTLAAVPAQVAADGGLTLFTRMRFTVSYRLTAAPAVAITGLTVNSGQPVRAGSAAVPLDVNVTSATARPITLTWAVADPSGLSLGGGVATANAPAGASQARLTLNAARWTPGPKTLSVSVADASGVLDAASAPVQVLGLRLAVEPVGARVQAGQPVALTVRAWDENGAAVTGLAGRLTVRVDGAVRAVTFTEGPAGQYRGALSTAGLALGGHQVSVAATDPRNLSAEAWTEFAAALLAYLPLVVR